MDRFPYDAEAREQRLTDLTRECADTIMQALAAGLPKTIALIDEALGEYMQNNQARVELLKRTAAGENPMQKIVDDLIQHEAEQRAEKEIKRLERERVDESLVARAERWLCDRGMLA